MSSMCACAIFLLLLRDGKYEISCTNTQFHFVGSSDKTEVSVKNKAGEVVTCITHVLNRKKFPKETDKIPKVKRALCALPVPTQFVPSSPRVCIGMICFLSLHLRSKITWTFWWRGPHITAYHRHLLIC